LLKPKNLRFSSRTNLNTKPLYNITIEMKKNLFYILILLTSISCFQPRYELSEKEKEFNPYQIGDRLIFESNTKKLDTFYISNIDLVYNDGLGIIEYKQALRVYEGKAPKENEIHDKRTFLLEICSGGSKEQTFIELRDFIGEKQNLSDLRVKPTDKLETNFDTFEDVISIKSNKSLDYDSKIYEYFWSLEKGIVRFKKGDSSIWTLKEFKR